MRRFIILDKVLTTLHDREIWMNMKKHLNIVVVTTNIEQLENFGKVTVTNMDKYRQ